MQCNVCGLRVKNLTVCPNCGNHVGGANRHEKVKKPWYYWTVVGILCCLVVMFVFFCFTEDEELKKKEGPAESRTIMIYMAGNDLESKGKIATADIESIDPDEIDLSVNKVLLYVGGTKTWHNDYIENDENAIFELKENGFEKVKVYSQSSLGNPDNLAEFLNYVSDNYETDVYSLIFWNHGIGALGSIADEYTDDYITLKEFGRAFAETDFKGDNKLDSILFRTCLNATLEMANTLAPYADYLIASEELTYGYYRTSVLNFINDVEIVDDAVVYGKKFISAYEEQIKELDPFDQIDSTYSIIDLAKLDSLNRKIDEFFEGIDLRCEYDNIARIRSGIRQFASDVPDGLYYDVVDLYNLIDELSEYDVSLANEIKALIDEVVVYNWGDYSDAYGLSTYFPYYGTSAVQTAHLRGFDIDNAYYDFIEDFSTYQSTPLDFNFSLVDNEVSVDNKEFSLKLTAEQIENYDRAGYIIFERYEDNYFMPIYSSPDAVLGDDGYLRTNIDDNLVKVIDRRDNSEAFVQVRNDGDGYATSAVLNYFADDDISNWLTTAAYVYLGVDEGRVSIKQLTKMDGASVGGAILKLEDYSVISFGNFRYKILDSRGDYIEDWESAGTYYLFEVPADTDEFEFKLSSLDDGDYYCVFKVYDIKNNYYYSKLVKIR